MKNIRVLGDKAAPLVLVGLLLVVWEVTVRWRDIPDWLLPAPSQVASTFITTLPLMAEHGRTTVLECLIGLAVAVAVAFIVAVLMDEIPLAKKALYPVVIASQTVPIVSVAPLFIIWFGYGALPKIIVVTLVCFFPITISLLGGLAGVDREYLDMFRSMRASRFTTFRMVKLPLALPAFFSGLRIAVSYSVMGAVIGEWLGAKQGLGFYLTLSQHSYQVDRVFAAILAITVLSVILFGLVGCVERLIIPWHRLPKM